MSYKTLSEWMDLYKATRREHGIDDADVWNMDETGFSMGCSGRHKAIIFGKMRAFSRQPGNRIWVTAIEAIGANGSALPPMIIHKGKILMTTWFEPTADSEIASAIESWTFATSPNGWTDNKLGLEWLQRVFEPGTYRNGRKRLLIMDGHGSHVSYEFQEFCRERNIITLCLPAHTSHHSATRCGHIPPYEGVL